jgi:hypothetical protein
VRGPRDIDVRVFCDPDSVYEYHGGEPTLIAAGMLLENMRIAAGTLGRQLRWTYQGAEGPTHHLRLGLEDAEPQPDPLLAAIWQRSVDRRPYRLRALDAAGKRSLERAAGTAFALQWFESLSARRAIAGLMATATDIRLRIPETFEIHRRIVDWNNSLSPHGIPASALGLDALTVKMMRWSLAERSRTEMSNRLGSPGMASLQMDLLPAIFSAAFFTFRVPGRPTDPDAAIVQLLEAGQAVQRFWLTATNLGLAIQPCFAPLAFSFYGRAGIAFTRSERERRSAGRLAQKLERLFPKSQELVFLGRIGWPTPRRRQSRSTRRDLSELVKDPG